MTASSDARVSSQYSCSSAGGASPPATNVRVMSAQQRDARSRGQMSIRTMPPRSIGPWPSSWPEADCAPWATIAVVGQLGVVLLADVLHALAHLLAREPGRELAQQRRGGAHRGVGGDLGAADAGELGVGLAPPPQVEGLVVDAQLDARAAQLVGPGEREVRAARARTRARSP